MKFLADTGLFVVSEMMLSHPKRRSRASTARISLS
jgi:hypothetical protein